MKGDPGEQGPPGTGALSVVDSNGLRVGQFVGTTFPEGEAVLITVAPGTVLHASVNFKSNVLGSGGPTIWFTTTDCSGQGYIENASLAKTTFDLPHKLVYGGGQPLRITMLSNQMFDRDGKELFPCQPTDPTDVFSGPYTEFDTTVFVPPFHLE